MNKKLMALLLVVAVSSASMFAMEGDNGEGDNGKAASAEEAKPEAKPNAVLQWFRDNHAAVSARLEEAGDIYRTNGTAQAAKTEAIAQAKTALKENKDDAKTAELEAAVTAAKEAKVESKGFDKDFALYKKAGVFAAGYYDLIVSNVAIAQSLAVIATKTQCDVELCKNVLFACATPWIADSQKLIKENVLVATEIYVGFAGILGVIGSVIYRGVQAARYEDRGFGAPLFAGEWTKKAVPAPKGK